MICPCCLWLLKYTTPWNRANLHTYIPITAIVSASARMGKFADQTMSVERFRLAVTHGLQPKMRGLTHSMAGSGTKGFYLQLPMSHLLSPANWSSIWVVSCLSTVLSFPCISLRISIVFHILPVATFGVSQCCPSFYASNGVLSGIGASSTSNHHG